MRYLYTTLLLLCVYAMSYGQNKKISIPIYNNKDTSEWYKTTQKLADKIGLASLTKSMHTIHFRLWSETQMVEVWTDGDNKYNGQIANYTTTYNIPKRKKRHQKPDKFYSATQTLNDTSAQDVTMLLQSFKVFQIQTDDSIQGWIQGKDGDEYMFEYATPHYYSFKQYWMPMAYGDIKEAVIINTIIKQLSQILNMKKCWSDFIHTLPKGSYHAGSKYLVSN